MTDANLLLNRLDARKPLSGEITLHPERARKAVEALAAKLGGLDVLAMADGIVRLAVVRMAGAIREVSVYRGHNPRDFVLLAFGGAGPMVASELASELGMRRVLIPPHPGNLSALGLLVSPLKRDFVRTRIARLADVNVADLTAVYGDLEARAVRESRPTHCREVRWCSITRSTSAMSANPSLSTCRSPIGRWTGPRWRRRFTRRTR